MPSMVKVPAEFKAGASLKWQIEIQNTLNTSAALFPSVPVWDLDLFHVARTPEAITYLRKQNPNVFIICYFNAGLKWPKFPDERWINIKNQTAVELIKLRITLAINLGCDAVDPDNIDGYGVDSDDSLPEDERTGWKLTEADDIAFMRSLSAHAHSLTTKRGYTMLIGLKNAPEIATSLLQYVDFAVLEDCKAPREESTNYVFCSDFQPFIKAGKPVLSIEYPKSIESPDGSGMCSAAGTDKAEYDASCSATKGNQGFSTVLKIKEGSGELNGCTQYCDAGFGKGVNVTATNSGRDGASCPAGST